MSDRLRPTKPTKAELAAAVDLIVPDLIAPALRVLFCGINPGLYTAAELSPDEYVAGGQRLHSLVEVQRPRVVAFLGIGAYRTAFGRPKAALGLQDERLADSALWVLPSPSGLNANHQLADLVALLVDLREWVDG